MKNGVVLLLVLYATAITQNRLPALAIGSVKPVATNRIVHPVVDPKGFSMTTSLANAVLWAYEIHHYQLSGGPPWAHRTYYEIEGRTQEPATPKEMRALLQGLLANRFQLKFHRETKELPVYALIVGGSGPKLQIANDTCGSEGCIDVGPGEFIARYATMDSTAATLSDLLDRPVLDRTGLNGRYDFRMKFDHSLVKPYDGQPAVPPDPGAPNLFAAIQAFGLRLEPQRAAVEIFVIDSAIEPSPN
jgi:uncharacterized protein (TIGR03435 family)